MNCIGQPGGTGDSVPGSASLPQDPLWQSNMFIDKDKLLDPLSEKNIFQVITQLTVAGLTAEVFFFSKDNSPLE